MTTGELYPNYPHMSNDQWEAFDRAVDLLRAISADEDVSSSEYRFLALEEIVKIFPYAMVNDIFELAEAAASYKQDEFKKAEENEAPMKKPNRVDTFKRFFKGFSDN